jgi:hypothetical protein
MTLLLESDEGEVVRRIAPAMPLRLGADQGKAAEDATHAAASLWGMPDFVFRPRVKELGSGTRELGDGILVAGSIAAVVQVKSRVAEPGHAERESSWVRKNAAKALAQARGTIRALRREPEPMTNMRGRPVLLDGNELSWTSVVVIDHPDPPPVIPIEEGRLEGAVVLLRPDWEFLFDHLKSTYAVCEYLQRVAGEPAQLGTEPLRFHQLAGLDAEGTPRGLPEAIRELGAPHVWEPKLPLNPTAGGSDREAHLFYRSLLEEVARIERGDDEELRVRALGELDRMPLGHRAVVAEDLRGFMELVSEAKGKEIIWRFKRVLGDLGSTQLYFGACSEPSGELTESALAAWAGLRHHEFTERVVPVDQDPVTVGIMVTPLPGTPVWSVSLTAYFERIDFDPDQLRLWREVWGDERSAMLA